MFVNIAGVQLPWHNQINCFQIQAIWILTNKEDKYAFISLAISPRVSTTPPTCGIATVGALRLCDLTNVRDCQQPCFDGGIRLEWEAFSVLCFPRPRRAVPEPEPGEAVLVWKGEPVPCAARRWSASVAMSCSCFLCSSVRPCVRAWYHPGLRFWIAAAAREHKQNQTGQHKLLQLKAYSSLLL